MEPIAAPPEHVPDFTAVQSNRDGQILYRKTTLLKPLCVSNLCISLRAYVIIGLICTLGLIILGSGLLATGEKRKEITGAAILGFSILCCACYILTIKKTLLHNTTESAHLPLSCVLVARQELEIVRSV